MELTTAIGLLNKVNFAPRTPQVWADLGAGDGLFTRALATLLPASSSIIAIDKNASALQSIPWESTEVALKIRVDDFTNMPFNQSFDGILIANALHYVQHQTIFLRAIKSSLKIDGQLLIVGYESRKANPWVPYPIDFNTLQKIGLQAGFSSIRKLNKVPSAFQGTMYSAALNN